MLYNDRLEEGLELLNEKALKSLEFFMSSGAGTLLLLNCKMPIIVSMKPY